MTGINKIRRSISSLININSINCKLMKSISQYDSN